MTNPIPVGEALRSARKARGLSLHEVAKATGISTATLSRIETEKQNVDVALFVSISRVLRVAPGDILRTGEGGESEEALAQTLATLPADKRARVISAASQGRAVRRDGGDLQARIDGLLATLDLVREELSDLQRHVSRRQR